MYNSIATLSNGPNTTVVVFSGSDKAKLDEVFGSLNVWLAAENGIFMRPPPDEDGDQEVPPLLYPCCTPTVPLPHPCCTPVVSLLHPCCAPVHPCCTPVATPVAFLLLMQIAYFSLWVNSVLTLLIMSNFRSEIEAPSHGSKENC